MPHNQFQIGKTVMSMSAKDAWRSPGVVDSLHPGDRGLVVACERLSIHELLPTTRCSATKKLEKLASPTRPGRRTSRFFTVRRSKKVAHAQLGKDGTPRFPT